MDPSWLEVDNVDRRSNLSLAEFREQYEIPNKPVILTDVVGAELHATGWIPCGLGRSSVAGVVVGFFPSWPVEREGGALLQLGVRVRSAPSSPSCNHHIGAHLPLCSCPNNPGR